MSDLSAFLRARIAEDEEVAHGGFGMTNGVGTIDLDEYCDVMVIDPDRLLADCTAKRRIVERYEAVAGVVSPDDAELDALALLDSILRDLAAVYADHGAYRPEWRPVA